MEEDAIMNQPLVSIVCEVFNHEPYLRRCLDGFVMQIRDFPFEILIHDDASTDGSANIIREYEKKYPSLFKPIYQKENQYSKGVNIWATIQFPRASGKYIAICEGDDFWTDSRKLQKEVAILEANPDLIGVVTNSMVVDKQGNTISDKIEKIYPGNLQKRYTLHDFFQCAPNYPTATVMFRNIHREEIWFKMVHTQSKYLGDWTLWAILHSYGDFYYLDDITSAYRINPSSLTHTVDRVGRAKANFTICKALSEVLPAEFSHYLKKDGWMYFSVFMAYRKEGKVFKMIPFFLWCLLRYPRYTIKEISSILKSH